MLKKYIKIPSTIPRKIKNRNSPLLTICITVTIIKNEIIIKSISSIFVVKFVFLTDLLIARKMSNIKPRRMPAKTYIKKENN